MDIRNLHHSFWIFENISARVRIVRKYNLLTRGRDSLKRLTLKIFHAQLTARTRRISGILLLAMVPLLGHWAYGLTQNEALWNWHRSHRPSPLVWKHAVLSQGLMHLADPARISQAIKNLPTRTDDSSGTWVSNDSLWITVFFEEDQGGLAVFCKFCDEIPSSWLPLGSGWPAFETAQSSLKKALTARPAAASFAGKALKPLPHDFREILY